MLQPAQTLEPETAYTFEVTPGLKDMAGARFAPYRTTFTTAAGATTSDYPVAFDKVLDSIPVIGMAVKGANGCALSIPRR